MFAGQEAKSGNCSLKTNCLHILHLACWPWKTGSRLGLACWTQLANIWFRWKTSNRFYFCCLESMLLSVPSSCQMLTWSDLLGDIGGPGNADFQQNQDKRDFPNIQKWSPDQAHGVSLAWNWKSDIKRASYLVILFLPHTWTDNRFPQQHFYWRISDPNKHVRIQANRQAKTRTTPQNKQNNNKTSLCISFFSSVVRDGAILPKCRSQLSSKGWGQLFCCNVQPQRYKFWRFVIWKKSVFCKTYLLSSITTLSIIT